MKEVNSIVITGTLSDFWHDDDYMSVSGVIVSEMTRIKFISVTDCKLNECMIRSLRNDDHILLVGKLETVDDSICIEINNIQKVGIL